jgi:hypothetical protein
MKIEVKSIKKTTGMEGSGFLCTIYMDGMKIGTAADYGDGGPINMHYDNISARPHLEDEAIRRHPDCVKHPYLAIECMIGSLVIEKQKETTYKRKCAKNTLFILKTDKKGQYWTINKAFNKTTKSEIMAEYGNNLVEIINERFVTV